MIPKLTTAQKLMADAVQKVMSEKGIPYNDAWNFVKRTQKELWQAVNETAPPIVEKAKTPLNLNPNPAQKKLVEAVNELMRKTGYDYHKSFMTLKVTRPELFAVNELPDNCELSLDGELLSPKWPVTPAMLLSLGLPIQATREQYCIAVAAEKLEITPQIAAKIIMSIVEFGRITEGVGFTTAFANLRKHRPEIFKALKKVPKQ
jgi:hypothetical protein